MGDEICGRCLVNPNSQATVRAIHPDGEREFCRYFTDPAELKKWVRERDDCRFEVDDTAHRFRPISTWHGDPVCSYHLWVLADLEMKSGYRR